MPGPGRNELCPCGSGRKVKRCCGHRRGPGEEDLARGYLAHQARAAARQLRGLDDDELRDLFDELFELPQLDLTLTITLPQLLTPDLQHLFDAVKADDPDPGDEVIPAILASLDTPVERARLARGSSTCATRSISTRCSRPQRSSTSTAARESSSTPA